jgi:GNAT superfamily N-acetyltransferase
VTTTEQVVRHAETTDRDWVVDAITEAFLDEPVTCWVLPDTGERRQTQPHHMRYLVDEALAHGEVITGGDGAAISLWLHEEAGEKTTITQYDELRAALGDELDGFWKRALTVAELTEARHPRHVEHLYLPCIGVVPERRSSGLGGALLEHRLAEADEAGLPVYLEASSPENQALYARHGFRAHGEPIELPGGPVIQPMWREPAKRR